MKRTSPCELCLIILAAILAAMFSGWFSPARAAAVSLHRVLATTRSGMEVDVYRAGPASAAVGILLSPSRRGVTPGIKQWATLLGQAGYRVLVIDLYGGRTYRSQAHARAAFAAIKSDVLQAQERVGLRLLRAPGRKLVAMGWGRFGGTRALEAALSNNGVVGGVVLYDDLHHLPSTAARLQQLKAPVLGVYFADERRSARLQAFSEAMRRAHKPFYVHYYPVAAMSRAVFAGPVQGRSDVLRAAWHETDGFLADMQHDCRRCAGLYRPHPRYRRRYYHHRRRYYRHRRRR